METDKEMRYYEAKERVKEIKAFYIHLITYIVIIGFLAFLNFKDGFYEYPWFLWPAAGWGVGLAFNAASAFRINPFFNKNGEKKKIEQYMQEEEEVTQQRWE
ncbi:2TM domain-containing protein [Mesonia ostreae]|uniref:2TM domain-containing protein n=1 Tax=Mesonia ostreae TaxID=861110 RepID=A0ABU2KLR5_9FLAO|nr:2TM domain-containing protein [Mesonia ostreae]MDT0295667.1 2TM domain-containing protein [Mesonia ostreae]